MITEELEAGTATDAATPSTSRQRILDIARRLFIEEGYLGVSMQQIADVAGLRKASLYHHFRSKDSLFADVMTQLLDRILLDFEAVDLTDAPIGEQLRQLALINYRQFDQPEIHRMAMDFFKNVPETEHTEIHERLRSMQDVFADLFERAIARGELRGINPQYAATIYFHMMMSLAREDQHFEAFDPPSPEEAAALVVDVLLNGLAPKAT